MSGQFGWFKSIGATDEAVAVLNDQPEIFTTLIVVVIALIIECLLIWLIHFKTMKPEQKNKKGGAANPVQGFFQRIIRK